MIIKSENNYLTNNEFRDFIIKSRNINVSIQKSIFIIHLYAFYVLESEKRNLNEIDTDYKELEKEFKINRISIYKNFIALEKKNVLKIVKTENNDFKEIILLNASKWSV